jgi:eukaryotic-like serine/threonine-protein kinase
MWACPKALVMSFVPGTKLGRYEILEPVGTAGMGEVYRARDTRLDRAVAIKIVSVDFGANSIAVERFQTGSPIAPR